MQSYDARIKFVDSLYCSCNINHFFQDGEVLCMFAVFIRRFVDYIQFFSGIKMLPMFKKHVNINFFYLFDL